MKNISIDEFRALKNGNISTDKFRALNTEMNEQRKKRAEEILNNLMNPISNIAQSTISGMQNRPTMSDILNDFNSKRKVFEEGQKKQATNTLNNIASKGVNLLDLVGNTTNNIIDDVRQSGAEDLSSYVQRKNQEKATTSLRTNPTSPLFDYGTFANEKIKQENRQNARYKSLTEAINGTQTQYGNINIKRNGINWNKDNIEQYKDRLDDLGIDTNNLEGSMSNVLGSSRTYNTKSGDIEVAYSPLLETSNGLTPLYQDEIDNYITDVLDKAEKEYKKGKYKTLKDAVIDLDKNGIGVKDTNGNEIKGLIADLGDTARKTGSEMHDSYERLQDLEQQKIQQALNLQNNLRTEGTAGQKVGYTVGDTVNNVTHGMTDTASNLLKGFLYWQGDMANAFNNKEKADLLYKIAGTKDAASQYVYEPLQEELEKYSKLDDTGRQVAQGIGQQMARVGLSAGGNILAGGMGLTETGTRLFNDIASNTGMFAGSMASARDEAISQGATQDQARVYGYLSGLSETASESMFGGFGKLTDAMGISRGIGGLDEKLSYGLRKNISNAFARNLVNLGVSAIGEGTEEVVSGLANAIWKKLTYLPDEDLRKLIEDEKLADSFVVGMLTSAIFQIPEYTSSSLSGTDMSTGQNTKEAVANEKLQQQYKSIMDEWKKENPEAYRMFKTSEEYFDKNPVLKEGSLIESAEKYGYDSNSVEIQATQRMLDKAGIKVEFSDEINDPNIEGLWTVDNNGNRSIIINPYASKETIFQKVAVHELTHDILNKNIKEAESFKKDILDLISKEKSFTEAKTKIENLYKNITENGKPIYDLTTEEGKKKFNDIVEEELITNAMAEKFGVQEEINKLVSYKPSLARRIYDKVVEFFGKATGNEKLLWKNVQNKFERAFSQEGQFKPNEDRYNATSQTDSQGRELSKEQQEYFKDSKVRDEDGNLIEVYHGTPEKEKFNVFDRTKAGQNVQADFDGIYFTDSNKFAERFSHQQLPTNSMFKTKLSEETGNIYKGYLNIQNPLNLNNLSEEQINELYNYIDTSKGMESKKDFVELLNKINNGVNPQLIKFYLDLSKVEKAGYDGIIANLGNKEEINGKYQNTNENEYIIFNSNQFKNIDNTNPTKSNDIRYSVNLSNKTQNANLPTTDNQGNTIKPGMQKYMQDSKARVDKNGQVDENGKLATVYHTTTDKKAQFNEFNPVRTPYYRFGDQVVNYYTDSKDMSGSYANNEYRTADTKKLDNFEDAKKWFDENINPEDGLKLTETTNENGTKTYSITRNGRTAMYWNDIRDTKRQVETFVHLFKNIDNLKTEDFGYNNWQYEGYVNITNPYIIDANGENWDTVSSRLSNTGEKLINILETIKKNKALNDIKTTLKDVEKNSYNIANEYAKTTSKMSFMANQLSDAIARTGDLESAKKQLKDLGWTKAEIENATKEKINNKSIIDIGLEYHNNKYDNLLTRAVENLKQKYKFLDNINDTQLDALLDQNFDEKKIRERYSENNTTNDIVKQVIEMNKNGANYDGVIMKNVIDYGGKSETREPANLYVTFNSNQFKAKDNENPTEDPDIRYSIENDSLFNLEGEGTRTKLEKLRTLDFEDKRLTRQERKIMESWRDTNYLEREKKLTDLINNSNLPEERKTELIYNELTANEDLDGIITEDILNKLENKITTIVNDFEKEYKEKQEETNRRIKEKQEEAKSWAIAKKEADTYDNKTYDLLERLEEKYPTNRNGKRTGKEWYDFANELGQELKKMGKSEQELDKIAKQTWYLYNPGQNRASSNKSAGYENNPVRVFNNSWVKAIKNGYESVNTILPTQAKIENKTIPIKEQQVTSQNKEIESREPIKTIENKEEIKSIKDITEPKVDIKDGEEAKILSEPLKRENKNRRFWAILKANIVDKGAVFEKISRLTKNRELQGKWDSTLTSGAKAQIAEANARYILDPKTNKETQVSKSLESIRDEVGDNRAAFQEYMYHQLNIDRMTLADRFEGMENKPVFGKFITADTSRDKVKQLETKYPEFKKYAQDIYDYLNENKRILVNSGVISQELSDKLDKMYPHYVPIQRIDNFKDAIAVPLDTRRTGVNAPLKSAKGGSQDIQPLFTTIQDRTLQTYKASDRNDFGLELMKSLKQLNQLNTTKEDINVDNIIEEITTENGNNELLKKGEKGKNPTFTVFENGKRVTFEINDDIYDALKPKNELLQRIDESKPAKTLRAISNFRRNLITEYNPLFMATNSIKDIQEVLFNSQHALKTYSKVPEAYAQIIKKGTWFKEYMQNGGVQNSYFTEGEFDQPKKSNSIAKKIITAPVNAISNLNEVIELAPRLAEYIASREEGRSIKTSMLDAARVTTNFKAGGDITKTLNRNGATFLNASVQGAAQVVRNFQEANTKGLKGYAVLVTKLTVAGLLPQLINGLIWDNDEDYQNLQDYIKDNYYIIGKVGDTFVRIPKGRAMATVQKIFNNAGEFTTSVGNLDGDKLASAFWKDLQEDVQIAVDNLAPNNPLENNILSPITQVISGKKWHGGDMIPTRLKDKPAVEQYDETTDSLSKFIGEKTGISPIKINYLIDQYSGGLGDVFLPMLTPQAENNPIEDKFTSNAIMKNKYSGEYFDTKEQLTIKSNSEKATDLDKIKASFLNSVQSNKKINANGVTESISDLYAQKRDIQNSSLPDETKKQQLKDVQRKINTKTEWALKQLDNIKIDGDIAKLNNNLVWCKDDGKWEKIDDKTLGKINDSNISLKKYVQYKQNVTTYKKATGDTNLNTKEAIPLLQKISMSDNDRAGIYKEFVNPQDSFYQAVSVDKNFDINAYLDYKLQDFESDKDSNGKTISNSRKKKVYNYIAQSSFDYPQRLMLTARDYKLQQSEKQYLAKYITNLDISTDEMIAMFDSMGNNFTVYNGQVYFK